MKMKYQIIIVMTILLISTGMRKHTTKQRIFMIGDSTMANKSEKVYPETGWGQALSELFNDNIIIDNHAVNGRSSKSFIEEGRWDTVINQLQKGDLIFIQFGHNDQKDQAPTRFTNPYTQYRANLQRYVNDSRAKGAIPVLFTSIVRRNFNEAGVLLDTHGAYTEVTRQVAESMNVPLIDLQLYSEQLVIQLGVEGSKSIYLHVPPGSPNYPDGKEDNTHLNHDGALKIAEISANELGKKFPLLNQNRKNK